MFSKIINKYKYLLLGLVLCTSHVHASLKNFEAQVAKMGFVSNVTNPGVIQDQQAGFLSGGSAIVRGNVDNRQLAWLELPSFKAGCGGIDLFGGGFGYINSKQLIDLAKNIAQNAVGYATYLAIDTISPEMGNMNKMLEAAARFINSSNVNSCQMAASMVAGAWPKSEQSERLACQARNMGSSAVSDFFTSRYECAGDKMEGTNKNKKAVNGMDKLLGTEYNLAWKALTAKGIDDKDTINLLLSISGTYISRKEGERLVADFKPSLADKAEFIEAFMHGGAKTSLYVCDSADGCLKMRLGNKHIEEAKSLSGKVAQLVESIGLKIRTEARGGNSVLTEEEKRLIELSSFPIINMIKYEVARKGSNVTLSINEYLEAISFDIAINYLDDMLRTVYTAVLELENAQFDNSKIESFRKEMRQVRRALQDYKQVGVSRIGVISDVKRRTELMRKQLRLNFEQYMS